jgi:hypothetical protein
MSKVPPPAAPVAPTLYAQGVPQGASQGVPAGGVVYGPFPIKPHAFRRFSLLAAVLLLISAGLIFANAAALLWPAFFLTWITWFPWVAQLGNFSFILGIVLGLVVLGAVFLYTLGFRVLSVFMVFPAAIVSLLIGGGFLVGLVLAVVTGIYMLMNEKYWH